MIQLYHNDVLILFHYLIELCQFGSIFVEYPNEWIHDRSQIKFGAMFERIVFLCKLLVPNLVNIMPCLDFGTKFQKSISFLSNMNEINLWRKKNNWEIYEHMTFVVYALKVFVKCSSKYYYLLLSNIRLIQFISQCVVVFY